MNPPLVTVSCAFYRCQDFVRDAVRSVLAQSMSNLQIVVVNDGDPVGPWGALADIDDPRLVRFNLEQNRGPYFAHEVVRRVARSPYFAVQDADDMSKPHRLDRLLVAIETTGCVAAASQLAGNYNEKSHKRERRQLGKAHTHRYCHAGLQRTETLELIGGYYGGYRIGWDTLVMNTLAIIGETVPHHGGEPIAFIDHPLYWIRRRDDSLTRSPLTGKGSPERERIGAILERKWARIFARRGKPDLLNAVRRELRADITPDDAFALDRAAEQLRGLL